jgi:signal transduction histidine kinase
LQDLNHVFDKFYQGNTMHKKEGSGLGLALAKRIIEVNDGEISVENNIGGGCTFTVKFNKR